MENDVFTYKGGPETRQLSTLKLCQPLKDVCFLGCSRIVRETVKKTHTSKEMRKRPSLKFYREIFERTLLCTSDS
jgi:hypothetical protein